MWNFKPDLITIHFRHSEFHADCRAYEAFTFLKEVQKFALFNLANGKYLNFLFLFVFFQCCVSFRVQQIYIYICVCVCILVHIHFHYRFLQDVEYSSLCYTVSPCLSILYVYIYISVYKLIPNSSFISPPYYPSALITIHFVFYTCESISFL